MSAIDYFGEQAARRRRLTKKILDYDLQRRLFDFAEDVERRAARTRQQQERQEHSSGQLRLTALMTGEIAFLYEAALELRAIATAVPKIAEELRRMAEELEEKADALARAQRDRFGGAAAP